MTSNMEFFEAPMSNLIPQVSFQSFWLVYGLPQLLSQVVVLKHLACKICFLQIPALLLGETLVQNGF